MSDEKRYGYPYREACFEAATFRHQLLTILYSARLARGLSRAQLAERMNTTEQRIRDIECGQDAADQAEITSWIIETGVLVAVAGMLMNPDDQAERDYDERLYMDQRLTDAYHAGDPAEFEGDPDEE
ncbi:helix-turn-helix domain-containing protein [Bifidobacterium cuniculi]|uniref:HTH cro/C1-type domain-containing protein n=1 Tax=Bifidobacterium cuniculi TaxID=1688 RepID=A0A087B508_9BIFI|nr:helix-turn-helix transcriptional regulator [Bifidobacterium cuniculi]KFI66108.1 hypothetical protein BCUN_0612 [Bifidobacterium cuniculi]